MNGLKYLHVAALAIIASAASGLAHAREEEKPPLAVGGAIRFNYVEKSWQSEYPNGFVGLDTARLDLNYDDGRLIGSAQYRYNHFPKGQGGLLAAFPASRLGRDALRRQEHTACRPGPGSFRTAPPGFE